jgi:heme a synthase
MKRHNKDFYGMTTPMSKQKLVSNWLFVCALMVFIMVGIGGATRLTESGLSITEWKPVTGIMPPLSTEAWQQEFAKYQQIPEYQQLNRGMSLEEYKVIFWWEYAHRAWGRLIGLVFALPLAFFWWRGYLNSAWKKPLLVLLALGAAQGFMGWYMVQSGLSVRTDVSQYRLTTHLGLAAIIFSALLWYAWRIRHWGQRVMVCHHQLCSHSMVLFLLFTAVFIMGGFMAGTNAGLLFKSFPLYNGAWWPENAWVADLGIANFFENTTLIHAIHRTLAIVFLIYALTFVFWAVRHTNCKTVKIPLYHVAGFTVLQATLGIKTIMFGVPVVLGVLHQLGGFLVLGAMVWALYAMRLRPAENL